jgi:hypothetical protein
MDLGRTDCEQVELDYLEKYALFTCPSSAAVTP